MLLGRLCQQIKSHITRTNRQAQAHSHYAVMLHREESDASWPSLPTNQAHAEKTAMNKNNRDCNVHELGDHLKCQRLRKSHVEGECNERIPDILQSSYMRENHSKRQFETIEQQ